MAGGPTGEWTPRVPQTCTCEPRDMSMTSDYDGGDGGLVRDERCDIHSRPDTTHADAEPPKCPRCHYVAMREDDEADWMCSNEECLLLYLPTPGCSDDVRRRGQDV